MPTWISMLRGVNVGGRHMVAMSRLRELYVELGLENPQTLVQSGNVVFSSPGRSAALLGRRIEAGIERSFGFGVGVVMRSRAELEAARQRNPFATRPGMDGAKLVVYFLAGATPPTAAAALRQVKVGGEELILAGNELFIYYPEGQGQSRMSLAQVDRALQTVATGRNWNTVNRLVELAQAR